MLVPIDKSRKYTKIINSFIDDESLTIAAIGLMCIVVRKHYVESLPNDVITLRLEVLYDYAKPTEKTNMKNYVNKIMIELRKKGYARLWKVKTKNGQYMMFYDFCEAPQRDWTEEYNYYRLPGNIKKACPTFKFAERIYGTTIYPFTSKKDKIKLRNQPRIQFENVQKAASPSIGNQYSVSTSQNTNFHTDNQIDTKNKSSMRQKSPSTGNQYSVLTNPTNHNYTDNQETNIPMLKPSTGNQYSVLESAEYRKSILYLNKTLLFKQDSEHDIIFSYIILNISQSIANRYSVLTLDIKTAFELCAEVGFGQEYLFIEKELNLIEKLGEKIHQEEYIKVLLTFLKTIKLNSRKYQPSYLNRAWADIVNTSKSQDFEITKKYIFNKNKTRYKAISEKADSLLIRYFKKKDFEDKADFEKCISNILKLGQDLAKLAFVTGQKAQTLYTIAKMLDQLENSTQEEIEEKYSSVTT